MRNMRGDTVVELMLAFAIFSLAAVTTIAILNQGVSIAQRSMEKSLVRQQVDSQAEIVRYIRSTNDAAWTTLTSNSLLTTNPMPLSSTSCPTLASLDSTRSFFITRSATAFNINTIANASNNYEPPSLHATVDYAASKSRGIWVQVAKAENRSGTASLDAYDFYIHGCWDSVGTTVPMTMGTIVRVYGQ